MAILGELELSSVDWTENSGSVRRREDQGFSEGKAAGKRQENCSCRTRGIRRQRLEAKNVKKREAKRRGRAGLTASTEAVKSSIPITTGSASTTCGGKGAQKHHLPKIHSTGLGEVATAGAALLDSMPREAAPRHSMHSRAEKTTIS